jgi:hypothetical protein
MHKDGEMDIRGTYCALAVATLTNIMDDGLIDKTAEWIMRYRIIHTYTRSYLLVVKHMKVDLVVHVV